MKKINSIKFSIILTDIFILLIFAITIALPLLVTWYVETANRLESLATTIMVTCYPCAPFTVLSLLYLRKLLKNFDNKNFSTERNVKYLKYMSLCCVIIAIITLIAGRYYLPFYLVAGTFLFLALLIFVLRTIFINIFIKE